jgi:ABC-type nitrate/sulfonate/bicarbonate transport system substrate-binding protein
MCWSGISGWTICITYETLDPRQYGIHALGTAYVTTEASVRQNPDALIGFFRALIAGWELVYADLDQATLMIGPETNSRATAICCTRQAERNCCGGGARFGEV